MRWTYRPGRRNAVNRLIRELGISRVTACLLSRLGIDHPTAAEQFLAPRLSQLRDPFELTNMQAGIDRLRQALRRAEGIAVFGDYDVDGVTSTVFLLSVLNRFGVYPRYIVPKRLEEGYGLSRAALDRLLEEGKPDLLIAVDCGTNSVDEVAYLRSLGIDVLIIDHHVSKDGIPEDCILINPHVHDGEDQPWSQLCSVGLIFKFIHALLKRLREEQDELAYQIDLKEYLDLVAVGTIADLVPLTGENRLLAKRGLERLKNTSRVGFGALFEVSGLTLGQEIGPFDIAFRLSPRINASGRLADASEPIELLLAEDMQEARQAARLLDDFNKERQNIEREITQQAEAMIEELYADAPGFVLYHPDWHPGVVGIVASRVTQKYYRPALVFGAEGEFAKGSGRSIPGLDLVQVLGSCTESLGSWGGHPMAVGVSASPAQLELLRESFCKSVLNCICGELPEPEIEIACWVESYELGENLLTELEQLGPFGQGNPEPVLGIQGVILENAAIPFGKGHFRFQIATTPGRRIQGVAWRQAQRMPPPGKPLDLAVKLSWNEWNGQRYPQLQLVDWRISAANRQSFSTARLNASGIEESA